MGRRSTLARRCIYVRSAMLVALGAASWISGAPKHEVAYVVVGLVLPFNILVGNASPLPRARPAGCSPPISTSRERASIINPCGGHRRGRLPTRRCGDRCNGTFGSESSNPRSSAGGALLVDRRPPSITIARSAGVLPYP